MKDLSERQQQNGLQTKRPWKTVLIITLVLLLLAAAGYGIWRLFFRQEEKMAVTGKTTYGTLSQAIEGSGTTTPADSISYTANGKILEWLVKAGDQVEAGTKLYVLDASSVEEQIEEQQTQLDELLEEKAELEEQITNKYVFAPISGRLQNLQAEADRQVQSGAVMATVVDSSRMKGTLYLSYAYQDSVKIGDPVTASLPQQMLTLTGTVTEIRYVDYVTASGMRCFAATVALDNPGSLTEGTTVTAWVETSQGPAYGAEDVKLSYHETASVKAEAAGTVEQVLVADYQTVQKGETLFVLDTSQYETQLTSLEKQITNLREKIDELNDTIETEYTRYSDIAGQVVSASYSENRMTGSHTGNITIYNQDTMQISINVDELDADYLKEGMEVYLYRSTSSGTRSYPATLSYLSLEASSSSSGVSTFAATITIDSQGSLASGVTVYYSITPEGGSTVEAVLAPISALFSYDDGYYLIVQRDERPENAIDPGAVGGSVTEFPAGYYAVAVEAGDYNGTYIQILSGVEQDETLFLRYMNKAPSGGSSTSDIQENDPMGDFEFGNMPGGMPSFGGNTGSPSGGMPSFGGNAGGGNMPSLGGNTGGRGG